MKKNIYFFLIATLLSLSLSAQNTCKCSSSNYQKAQTYLYDMAIFDLPQAFDTFGHYAFKSRHLGLWLSTRRIARQYRKSKIKPRMAGSLYYSAVSNMSCEMAQYIVIDGLPSKLYFLTTQNDNNGFIKH